jgi:predicted transport protein
LGTPDTGQRQIKQSRDISNIGHTVHRMKTNKTTRDISNIGHTGHRMKTNKTI